MRLSPLGRVLLYTGLGALYGLSLAINVCRAVWPFRRLDTDRCRP